MAALPKTGDRLWGFTVTETGTIEMLGARTVEFYHSHSGARLLYIENDDRELGFNLIYRTPQADNTDTNHLLEHLLLCSCRRYPSRDVFFDMDSKSYSTFMNGITDNTYTCYPICSQSQEQLTRLADVVLSCMEEPDAMKEEAFFLREGLRLELEEENGPLTLHGTVLSEDWGHLTDLQENADSFMAGALYEGLISSRLLGRLHYHYKELTFSQVKKAYEAYYHYDNCLMILYGQVELERFLQFLDENHLSQAEAGNGGISPDVFKEAAAPGFKRLCCESPAYEGTAVEQGAVIDYGIDLSHCSQEELIHWDLLADFLNQEASLWYDCAREQGINHMMEVYTDTLIPSPSLRFRLRNGDAGQAEPFLRSIQNTLSILSSQGADPEQLAASWKENRISDLLTREAPHLGFNISEEIGHYWSVTGRTDYFAKYEAAFQQFYGPENRKIVSRLAKDALEPVTSALVITVPKPGLAEQLEAEREAWLEQKLGEMSAAERQELITRTRTFQEWNSQELSNMDFLIDPSALPEPPDGPPAALHTIHGIQFYETPSGEEMSSQEGALGSYQLYFDMSGVKPEDGMYLTIYQMLLTELDTELYTSARQKQLEQEYLHDCSIDEVYPDEEAGENSRPMLSVFWNGLTEDFPASLRFLLHIMGQADYENREEMIRVLEKYTPDYDLSKGENASSLAFSMAAGCLRKDAAFHNLLNGQDTYYFLQDTLKRLKEDPDYVKMVSGRLRRISDSLLTRHKLIFLTAAPSKALEGIRREATKILGELPEGGIGSCASQDNACLWEPYLSLEPKTIGICTDAPSQEIRMMGNLMACPGFKGRFLPFLLAVGDKYIKPALRYQGGAYDGGIDFYLTSDFFSLWSTADPEVTSTLSLFQQAGARLGELTLTEEDLKGYILSAYSQALPPSGRLNGAMRFLRRLVMGFDTEALNQTISDIKNASLDCQKEAADFLCRALRGAAGAVAGNEHSILEHGDEVDVVLNLRERGGSE